MNQTDLTRRKFLAGLGALSAAGLIGAIPSAAQPARPVSLSDIRTKPIPSTGEQIPVIGMGTWITFNVGQDKKLRNHRSEILREFFTRGGGMIDCSPMYGSSADVLGYALQRLENKDSLFSASKVWTSWTQNGPGQIREQQNRWGVDKFDLMQIHNLRNWEGHLETLQEKKEKGEIRYVGITTSHGRRHNELEYIMRTRPVDFVQLTYNIGDRAAEDRLLPLAREKGIAVIANRPFRRKELFRLYQHSKLPEWAEQEAGAINWAEFFLKFIISHRAVTCTIPATSQIPHMKENMGALKGRLPSQKTRERMVSYIENL